MLQACVQACDDLGTIATERLWHILVGRALARPRCIQLRIRLVDLHKCVRKGFRPGRDGSKKRKIDAVKENIRRSESVEKSILDPRMFIPVL